MPAGARVRHCGATPMYLARLGSALTALNSRRVLSPPERYAVLYLRVGRSRRRLYDVCFGAAGAAMLALESEEPEDPASTPNHLGWMRTCMWSS